MKLTKNAKEELLESKEIIKRFLDAKKFDYDIEITTFADQESDKQIEIAIKIDADLKLIYEQLKPAIFKLIANGLSQSVFDYTIVSIGNLNRRVNNPTK